MQPTVYFHDVMSAYPAGVLDELPGVPSYTARALAMSRADRGDAVLIPEIVKPHLPWVRAHYERIGLGVASTVLYGGYETLERFSDHEMSVFIFGDQAHAVRPNQARQQAVRAHNNKNTFIDQICRVVGAPTPHTVCFDYPSQLSEVPLPYPLFVKGAESASGQDVFRCRHEKDVAQAVAEIAKVQPQFQLQAALPEDTVFLNVQYRAVDGQVVRGPITRQILTGNSHDGNIHPSGANESRVWSVTDPLAEYAVREGIEEVWAYDVAWLPDGSFLVIECNPRFNGCTYYSEVARRLDLVAWEARNVQFLPGSFEGIDLGELEYRRGQGIIVVNWGCVTEQKLGLFIAGTSDERAWYHQEFVRRFNRRSSLYAIA